MNDASTTEILEFFKDSREAVLASEEFQQWKNGFSTEEQDGTILYYGSYFGSLVPEDELILEWGYTHNLMPPLYLVRIKDSYDEVELISALSHDEKEALDLEAQRHMDEFVQWVQDNHSNAILITGNATGMVFAMCSESMKDAMFEGPHVEDIYMNETFEAIDTEMPDF